MRSAIATTCALGLLAAVALPAFATHQQEPAREALTATVLRSVPEGATQEDQDAIAEYIGNEEYLSNDQVEALNRFLHNTQNGWVPELTLQDLTEIADNEYNDQQIFMFTKAREEYAKFMELGMDDKAKAQFDKFSEKVERLGDSEPVLDPASIEGAEEDLTTREAKRLAKDAAQDAAAHAARGAALRAAKLEAREDAKNLAKQETRDQRRVGKALGKTKR